MSTGHKGHLTSKLNYRQFPSYLLSTILLYSLYPSLISYFTFPGVPYRISLLFLPWLPCHFYLVVIEQQRVHLLNQSAKFSIRSEQTCREKAYVFVLTTWGFAYNLANLVNLVRNSRWQWWTPDFGFVTASVWNSPPTLKSKVQICCGDF